MWDVRQEPGKSQPLGLRKIRQQKSFLEALRRKPDVSTLAGLLRLLGNKCPKTVWQKTGWVTITPEYEAGIAWFWKVKHTNTSPQQTNSLPTRKGVVCFSQLWDDQFSTSVTNFWCWKDQNKNDWRRGEDMAYVEISNELGLFSLQRGGWCVGVRPKRGDWQKEKKLISAWCGLVGSHGLALLLGSWELSGPLQAGRCLSTVLSVFQLCVLQFSARTAVQKTSQPDMETVQVGLGGLDEKKKRFTCRAPWWPCNHLRMSCV